MVQADFTNTYKKHYQGILKTLIQLIWDTCSSTFKISNQIDWIGEWEEEYAKESKNF
jgi:hypothetical protein